MHSFCNLVESQIIIFEEDRDHIRLQTDSVERGEDILLQ